MSKTVPMGCATAYEVVLLKSQGRTFKHVLGKIKEIQIRRIESKENNIGAIPRHFNIHFLNEISCL